MEIGINAAAAFKVPRTGVEEYTYQLIKNLAMLKESQKHSFILYVPQIKKEVFKDLPSNFILKELKWIGPAWTQCRLAAHLALKKPEKFLIPVHVLPRFSPKDSIVVIHGLEYEYYSEMYPKKHLKYLKWSTQDALKRASKVITVSENTKQDLIKFYKADPEKIFVVHHGFNLFKEKLAKDCLKNNFPYLLYLGRLEIKKNILGLIQAFELLKKKYQVPHKLILAGPSGFGYDKIQAAINKSAFKNNIIQKGYVSEKEKIALLNQAEMFVFVSFYEGFGMPILEAQALNCPVLGSNNSSIPEVAGSGSLLINPKSIEQIAKNMYKIIKDQELKKDLIQKGKENLNRFSWQKCARETLSIISL